MVGLVWHTYLNLCCTYCRAATGGACGCKRWHACSDSDTCATLLACKCSEGGSRFLVLSASDSVTLVPWLVRGGTGCRMERVAKVRQPGTRAAACGLCRGPSLRPDTHRRVHAVACPAWFDLQHVAGMCQSQLGQQVIFADAPEVQLHAPQ